MKSENFRQITPFTLRKLQRFTLISHFFRKKFVKVTVLLKKLLNSWFDEIFVSVRVFFFFSFFHTVPFTLLKLRNFTATVFWQIFRQIKVLLKNFTMNWFDGKNLWQWISSFSTLWPLKLQYLLTFSSNHFAAKSWISDFFFRQWIVKHENDNLNEHYISQLLRKVKNT